MGAWLIAIVGVIYAIVTVSFLAKGNYHMAIAFSGYAWSNVGFYLAARVG